MCSTKPVVVTAVANVSVVLAATLVPLNAGLVGANVQEAPMGSAPQANVTVPVYRKTGVPVITLVTDLPWVTVSAAGVAAKLIDGI